MNSQSKFQSNAIFLASLAMLLALGEPLVAALVAPGSSVGSAYAQESESSHKPQQTRRVPAMRERTYKKLAQSQEDAEKGRYDAALSSLNALRQDTSLNEYELAMTWNFIAFVYSSQEKYKQALNAYEEILKLANIPEALEQQTLLTGAQLELATDNPRGAIKYIDRYHKVATPTPQSYIVYGQACYVLEDYKCTVKQVESAVSLSKSQGGQPQEQWLLILRAAYYETNNTPKMIDTLELLVHLYPKGDYFAQLSAMYSEVKQEDRQLAVLEAEYDGGYFTKRAEYLNLASLLLNADVPYKAAKVLIEGMDKKIVDDSVSNLKMLAQAWLVAQEPEKSITVLKKAAGKAEDGELYVRLGQSYMNLDDWTGCITAIRDAFKKGGIKRADSAHVNMGICLFNIDKLDEAIEHFKEAAKDERSAHFAKTWIEYLRSEQSRRRSLAESLI